MVNWGSWFCKNQGDFSNVTLPSKLFRREYTTVNFIKFYSLQYLKDQFWFFFERLFAFLLRVFFGIAPCILMIVISARKVSSEWGNRASLINKSVRSRAGISIWLPVSEYPPGPPIRRDNSRTEVTPPSLLPSRKYVCIRRLMKGSSLFFTGAEIINMCRLFRLIYTSPCLGNCTLPANNYTRILKIYNAEAGCRWRARCLR